MNEGRSHGRLGFWKLAGIMAVPASVALAGGAWLCVQSSGLRAARVDGARMHEVSFRARLLADEFRGTLDRIRLRALAIQHARLAEPEGTAFLEDPVLLWAEVELATDARHPARIRQALNNPTWSARDKVSAPLTSDDAEISAAILGMDLGGLEAQGTSVRRIRPDPQIAKEWVAFAFASPVTTIVATAAGPLRARTAVVALVDPTEAFPEFRRWSGRGDAGSSRAYWLGLDGTVLAHSQRAYQGANFGRLPIFHDAVGPYFRAVGSFKTAAETPGGKFRAIDQLPAYTSFARPDGLPIALVVEEVAERNAGFLPAGLRETFAGWLGMIAVVFGAVLLLAGRLRAAAAGIGDVAGASTPAERVVRKTGTTSASTATARMTATTRAPAAVNAGAKKLARLSRRKRDEMRLRAESEAVLRELRARPATLADTVVKCDPEQFDRLSAAFEGEEARRETSLGGAVAAPNDRSVPAPLPPERLEEAILQFESEDEDVPAVAAYAQGPQGSASEDARAALHASRDFASHVRSDENPAVGVAQQLVELAARIGGGRPTLFFAHHERANIALLQACSGVDASVTGGRELEPDELMFPVLDSLRRSVLRQESRGLISVRDYAPLGYLLERRFGVGVCDAWAITGRSGGSSRLLGILALLARPEEAAEAGTEGGARPGAVDRLDDVRRESMLKLIQSTEPVYEKTLAT